MVKLLSDMFPIKNCLKEEDVLSLFLFNCALEYAIRRVHTNQESLILNGTHQLVVNADNANVLGGNVHTIKKNNEA